MSRGVVIYRGIVCLLAAGYSLRMLLGGGWDGFGGPLRFLTIWALLCSLFAASLMLSYALGRNKARWGGFAAMTAVLNAMVVYLYWSLYLDDPASVTRDGQLMTPYLEWYLHGLGPLLQWVDALFIHRAFGRPRAALGWLVGLISLYILWIETVVRPLNDWPQGQVTSGLPYQFLNNLVLQDRAVFYAGNFAAAVVLLGVFAALGWVISRRDRAARPAGPPDSRDSAG